MENIAVACSLRVVHDHIGGTLFGHSRGEAMEQAAQQQQYREDRPTLVMVVDDSVTVRKVTSRLLESPGYPAVGWTQDPRLGFLSCDFISIN